MRTDERKHLRGPFEPSCWFFTNYLVFPLNYLVLLYTNNNNKKSLSVKGLISCVFRVYFRKLSWSGDRESDRHEVPSRLGSSYNETIFVIAT